MGVVKNLMVRVGADVRSLISGMKAAGSVTGSTAQKMKVASVEMRKSIKDSFSTSRMSVKEYSAYVEKTKQDHAVATQSVQKLTEEIAHLTSVYDSVRAAADGLDMSKSLNSQIQATEKEIDTIAQQIDKVREQISYWNEIEPKGMQFHGDPLRAEMQGLIEKSDAAVQRLAQLEALAGQLGQSGSSVPLKDGLQKMQTELQNLQNQLNVTKQKAEETGQKLAEMGDNPVRSFKFRRIGEELGRIGLNAMDSFKNAKMDAPSAALGSVKRLWDMLKNFGGSMTSGIASAAAKILGIGRNASASTDGLEKMVRSIRNIGIVALGMRVFRGIFGELQSVVSNYISSNDALSASVSALKAQLGQALAPAINMVIAVMQRLMPIIQTIASAISAVLTALFGRVKITTSGIRAAAGSAAAAAESLDVLSFDKINKLSDNSGGGGGGGGLMGEMELGEPPEWVKAITDWIEKMKEAFRAGDWEGLGRIFGEGINAAVDAINAVDIGTKIGTFVDNFFTVLHSALSTINFFNIGAKVGQMITAGVSAVNWNRIGETIGMWFTILPSVLVGFIQETDWGLIARALSNSVVGALTAVTNWVKSIEWSSLGKAVGSLVSNINWIDVFASLGSLMWEGVKAALETLSGFIKNLSPNIIIAAILSAISVVSAAIAGKALLGPILAALGTALATAVSSIITAIAGWPALIIAAGGAAIATVALWLKDGGADVVAGFLQGIKEGISNIWSWINTHVFTPFVEAFRSIFGIHSPSTVMHALGVYLITGLLNGLTETWQMIVSFFEAALNGLVTQFTQGWKEIQSATKTSWGDIANTVSSKVKSMQLSVGQEVLLLRQQMLNFWTNVLADAASSITVLTSTMKAGFELIRANSTATFTQMLTTIRQLWQSCVSFLTSQLNTLVSRFRSGWSTLQTNTENTWKSMVNNVTSQANSMAKELQRIMEALRKSLQNTWSSIASEAASGASQAASNAISGFNSMLIGIQSICSQIVSAVSSMCSQIEAMCAAALAAINRVRSAASNIPTGGGGGGDPTGGAGGTSMRLASGGITLGPTYARIGEAGTEAVLPLENNTSWMDTLAQRITATGGTGSGPLILQIYLSKTRKLAECVIKDINQITKTTGVCPIQV